MIPITGSGVFRLVAVIAILTTLAGAQSAKKAAGIALPSDAGPTTGTLRRRVSDIQQAGYLALRIVKHRRHFVA